MRLHNITPRGKRNLPCNVVLQENYIDPLQRQGSTEASPLRFNRTFTNDEVGDIEESVRLLRVKGNERGHDNVPATTTNITLVGNTFQETQININGTATAVSTNRGTLKNINAAATTTIKMYKYPPGHESVVTTV